MSNLLSSANLYNNLGEFTFVSAPKTLTVSLVVKPPIHKVKFKEQNFSFVQSMLPLYISSKDLEVTINISSRSNSNAIRSSSHSLVVI